MRIGDIALPNPVALAPMAGVTDLPFRRLCRRLGTGYVVGEMLASDPSLRSSSKSRLRGVHHDEPAPRAIQIVGWDPAVMADAARFNADQGASVIDINMGCPAKKVLKRAAGSALLADEVLVGEILESVVSAVQIPVTLKIRTGTDPGNRNGVRIAKIAESSGVRALAVHGRTRACKFGGAVEFSTIRDICRQVGIPVFANGDIVDCEGAAEVRRFTGAAGLMIGRGAHGAPWFPGMVARYLSDGVAPPPPELHVQAEIVQEHLSAIYAFYGVAQGVRVARKHIKWYLDLLRDMAPGAEPKRQSVRSAALTADCPDRQLALLAEYYKHLQETESESTPWQIPDKRTTAYCRTTIQAWRRASGTRSEITSRT